MSENIACKDTELINPENVNRNFTKALINFASFLNNEHKFNVSIDTIIMAVENVLDVDVFDQDAMRKTLKTIMCKSATEFAEFDNLFVTYFSAASLNQYNDIVEETKAEEFKKIKMSFPSKAEALKSLKNESGEDSEFLKYEADIRRIVGGMDLEEWSEADLINVCKKDRDASQELACRHLLDGDDRYLSVKKNLEDLMKICIQTNEDTNMVMYILSAAQELQDIYKHIKEILDKREDAMNAEMVEIEKNMSKIHRDEYVYGKNAVKTYSDLLEENLTQLSNSDMVRLSQYIRQNAYKFRTRIAMNMKRSNEARIDFKRTVKNSIRAGGIPYKIEKQKPHPTKTKIITICDVSGSCIKSSRMLLNFLYELQSVFPGGCESFVFVSELANVTSVFKQMPVSEACSKAVNMVPRKYSNYCAALEMFKNKHMDRIGKDTIVIFLGDARNNNNPTGEEIMAQIKSKAKKIYWLETDPKGKWGEGDSAINSYMKYISEIRELLKPKDIIDFLCSVSG